MKYLKIKIADVEYKDTFYRTVLINPKLNLYQFSIYIELLFKAAFCHMAMFIGDNVEYIDKLWLDEFASLYSKALDYTKVTIGMAFRHSPKLSFVYDTGDNYQFDLNLLEELDFPSRKNLIILEASGDGIWEDNHGDLCEYLDGRLANKDIYAWNLNIPDKKAYNFFAPIDVDKMNEKLESKRRYIINLLKRNKQYSDH